jgi:hypothetical protein
MENVAFKGIYLNFGTSKRKRLHKICLTGEGDGILYVYTDNCVKAYEFGLPYGTTDIQVIGKGKYFQFELNLFSDARVDTMEVYYTVEE